MTQKKKRKQNNDLKAEVLEILENSPETQISRIWLSCWFVAFLVSVLEILGAPIRYNSILKMQSNQFAKQVQPIVRTLRIQKRFGLVLCRGLGLV